MKIQIRQACEKDIPALLHIRETAKENILRTALTADKVRHALNTACRGWVAHVNRQIIGFSIANKKNQSIWALFVLSPFQRHGVGRHLLEVATDWLWSVRVGWLHRPIKKIWLDTKQGSPAEGFYQHLGWQRGVVRPFDEVRYWLKRPLKGKNA